jgi:3-dehydroquinate synthase
MRGIPWIAVPTSLLAQVDASVGGKTAVNHPECKNLIGAFHQPAAVLCDTETLQTLPDEELRTGLAEVVKHAVIRDADLLALLETRAEAILARDPAVLETIVARNVRIKAEVVMADERESDLRRILNYGHTVGHALESMLGLRHGRAIALGMVAEARIALGRGLIGRAVADRQEHLLNRFRLPTRLAEPPDVDACLVLVKHDKKALAGAHHVVLPTAIGRAEVFSDVTDREICEAIAALRGK